MSALSIVGGLALIIVAGALNGSWNVSFNKSMALVDGSIDFGGAWLLFQLYAALLNIPVCLYWAGGPDRVSWIVQERTSTRTVLWVCFFSVVWGCGSIAFGVACKVAGVGVGTNLTIGLVTVLGALLPLIFENKLWTKSGVTILSGLAICCVGLAFSMKSLQERDRDESSNTSVEGEETGGEESVVELDSGDNDNEGDKAPAVDPPQEKVLYSTATKVSICAVAGVLATQLQFAFVFGQPMVDDAASERGPQSTTPTGYAAVIWLFAFTTSAPVSILYGLYTTQYPYRNLISCGLYQHAVIFLSTTIPWVAHVHLYGIANTILPDALAAAVSWPVLMMVTVVVGMMWSFLLGEWEQASSRSKGLLYSGLAMVLVGISVLMISLVV